MSSALRAVETRIENKLDRLHYQRRKKIVKLLDHYSQARSEVNSMDKETIIAHEIRRTTMTSFCKHGDRNCLTPGMILHYIRKDGCPLDGQALYITENYNVSITENDLYEFMLMHPNGISSFYKFVEMETVKREIKSITGFNTSPAMIKRLRNRFVKQIHSIQNTPF